MNTLIRRCVSNKISILDIRKNKIVADLDKKDLKQELEYFINQEKNTPKTESLRLRLFYNEDTGCMVFGKKVYTKNGKLNKSYLRNHFLRPNEKNFEKAKKLLNELNEEIEKEDKEV